MEEVIIKSKWDGWVTYIIWMAVICAILILNPPPKEIFWPTILIFTGACTGGIVFMAVIERFSNPYSTIPYNPWYMRKVTVYSQHIEVTFPFHKKWNYQVNLRDIDGYCVEEYKVRGRHGNIIYHRIYLMTGSVLWAYVAQEDVSNFHEMLLVLKDDLGIYGRPGYIEIDKEDAKTVRHGGCITLMDIDSKEIADMRARRSKSPSSRFREVSTAKKYKVMFRTYALPIIIFAGVLLLGRLMPFSHRRPKHIESKKNLKTEKAEEFGNIVFVPTAEDSIKSAQQLYNEALTMKEKHNHRKAFPLMKLAAEKGNVLAQYELGEMYEQGLGTPCDSASATHWYTIVDSHTEDKWTRTDALIKLSQHHANRQNYKKAIATINKAIAINPYDARPYDCKGEYLYKSGDKQGARYMWKEVTKRNPHYLDRNKSELHDLLYGK